MTKREGGKELEMLKYGSQEIQNSVPEMIHHFWIVVVEHSGIACCGKRTTKLLFINVGIVPWCESYTFFDKLHYAFELLYDKNNNKKYRIVFLHAVFLCAQGTQIF